MVRGLLKTMRPRQWVKNLFVLAPLVFAKELFDVPIVLRSLAGFFAFCLLASTVYVLNDLVDVEADRIHPVKKNRPIASGALSEREAKRAGLAIVATAFGIGALLGGQFFLAAAAYLALNIAYSFRLKKMAYIDVLCIAAGFELRVLAGSFAARVPPSGYLLLVTFLLATFLGLGKRMHELTQSERSHKQRAALATYNIHVVRQMLRVTAVATILTYAIYTLDESTRTMFGTDYLFFTTLFGGAAIARFLHLVSARPEAESPTEEMLRDKWFLANLAAWAVTVVALIYFA